jgi:hypothetical protein
LVIVDVDSRNEAAIEQDGGNIRRMIGKFMQYPLKWWLNMNK